MSEEVFLYRDATIQVTNLRAILPGKTYAMANVTSVSTFTVPAKRTGAVILAIFGALIVVAGLSNSELRSSSLTFGGVMLVIGIAMAAAAKNVYWLRIGSASGETNALSSHDYDYVARIVHAINDAIVRRG